MTLEDEQELESFKARLHFRACLIASLLLTKDRPHRYSHTKCKEVFEGSVGGGGGGGEGLDLGFGEFGQGCKDGRWGVGERRIYQHHLRCGQSICLCLPPTPHRPEEAALRKYLLTNHVDLATGP